jgi:hypothetical protein
VFLNCVVGKYLDVLEEPTSFIFRVTTELVQVDAAVIQRKIYISCVRLFWVFDKSQLQKAERGDRIVMTVSTVQWLVCSSSVPVSCCCHTLLNHAT